MSKKSKTPGEPFRLSGALSSEELAHCQVRVFCAIWHTFPSLERFRTRGLPPYGCGTDHNTRIQPKCKIRKCQACTSGFTTLTASR